MKKRTANVNTDDASFGVFMSTMSHDHLCEHAHANLLSECIIEYLISKNHLVDDCMTMMLDKDVSISNTLKYKFIKEEAEDEEFILTCLDLFFSKKELIDMILEYTDEDSRIDIVENELAWEKPNSKNMNLN